MYVHKITFDNNDEGDYSSKQETCTKFREGQVADYTIETKVNGQYTNIIIKPAQQDSQQFVGKKFAGGSDKGFCLSYAKDLAVAYIEKGKNIEPEKVCKWADVFLAWMEKGKEQVTAPIQQAQTQAPAQKQTAALDLSPTPNDDLPF